MVFSTGYYCGAYDGRNVYFIPIRDSNTAWHANVLRYDTQGAFKSAPSWQAYDASDTDSLATVGFNGATFDGRYLYFVPGYDNSGRHGRVLRYDTQGGFKDSASWSAYDAGNTNSLSTIGYTGAIFDGRFVYFVPANDGTDFHGRALRFDTQGGFSDSASWTAFDAGTTDGLTTKGFAGGTFDGRHIYFSPWDNGSGAKCQRVNDEDGSGLNFVLDTIGQSVDE